MTSMFGLLNGVAFASALTAIFAFRFQERRPAALIAYFALFATIEGFVHTQLPEGAVPPITAVVLLGITCLFLAANYVLRKVEARSEVGEDD